MTAYGTTVLTARTHGRRRGERTYNVASVTHEPGCGKHVRPERPAVAPKRHYAVDIPDLLYTPATGSIPTSRRFAPIEANTASEARSIVRRAMRLPRLPVGSAALKISA